MCECHITKIKILKGERSGTRIIEITKVVSLTITNRKEVYDE